MRISDWSSDVCSSDLGRGAVRPASGRKRIAGAVRLQELVQQLYRSDRDRRGGGRASGLSICPGQGALLARGSAGVRHACKLRRLGAVGRPACRLCPRDGARWRACAATPAAENGRATGRERVCTSCVITVVRVPLKKKKTEI